MKFNRIGLLSGGLGVVPAATADPRAAPKPPPTPRPLSAAEAQVLMMAELLQAAQGVAASSTALLARIGREGALNGVLGVHLVTMPADGWWTVDYPVAVGSIALVNHGIAANVMTVHSGQPGLSAPSGGNGVQRVAGGGVRLTMPIGARELAVWGTVGDQFSLQAFTGLQAFGVGL